MSTITFPLYPSYCYLPISDWLFQLVCFSHVSTTNSLCNSPVLHTCHILRPSHNTFIYLPNDAVLAVHIIKLTAVYSCPLPPHADPLTIYPTQQPILNTVSLIASLNITDRVSQSQSNQHNYICVYFIFTFLDSTIEVLESVNTT